METMQFMVRVVSSFYYTLEFLIAVSIFCLILYFYVKKIDRKSFYVFLIAGAINTSVELFLQGFGTRVIEGAYFFNIPIDYPFICFILGFYEGGVKTLIAYHFVMLIFSRNKFSKRFCLSLIAIVVVCFLTYSIITAEQLTSGAITRVLTVRSIFAPLSIIFLVIAFVASTFYFIFNRNIPKHHKITLLYYEIGVVLYLLAWLIPLHAFSLRYIGIYEMGTYIPASLLDQLLLMYGYFLFFEGVGVNIILYPIIYRYKLIDLDKAR